jgi:hypothetical protein
MTNQTPDKDGFFDHRDERCEICVFRAIASFREASEANIPLDVIAGGTCRKCLVWLGMQSGTLSDGTLTLRLTGDGLLDVVPRLSP